ncbi:MAG: protoporphyrinogen oxidase [Vicinamibacteria bacterium]
MRNVLVIGGGIAGLTVAYALGRRGVDVLLVEAEDRLGGLISTSSRDGFLLDGGPDAFLAAKPHARLLCEELGLGDELIPTNPDRRRVYVLHQGRLKALPEGFRLTVPTRYGPFLSTSLFSWKGKLRMLLEPFVPKRRADVEESIASFVVRRFGKEALERVGEPLLAGIHCGDPERLSMDFLFPGLVAIEREHGSLTLAMRREGARGEEALFLSLAGGMGRLVERLAAEIPGEARLGRSVAEIRREGAGFESLVASGERLRSRAILLALPIRESQRLLAPVAPEAASSLSRIATVSTAVSFHAFPRDNVSHPLDAYGFIVPETEPSRLLAATFVTSKFPNRAPEGQVLIRTFLGGRRDGSVLDSSDAALEALSLSELARVLGPMGTPTFSRVVRWPDRTPQIEVGHRSTLAVFEKALGEIPGLFVLGSGLGGVGIPDSIAAARETALRIAEFLEES